jgi:hypothetical protein
LFTSLFFLCRIQRYSSGAKLAIRLWCTCAAPLLETRAA